MTEEVPERASHSARQLQTLYVKRSMMCSGPEPISSCISVVKELKAKVSVRDFP